MNFYMLSLVIALGILIICLIGIGILMQYQNAGMKFPLHPNVCPDFWTVDNAGTTCTKPASGTNAGTNAKNTVNSLANSKDICTQYKWSRQNNVNWDGVSNYNGCA